MQAFTQYTPTRIVFGKDTEHQAGSLAKQVGATRVFDKTIKGDITKEQMCRQS